MSTNERKNFSVRKTPNQGIEIREEGDVWLLAEGSKSDCGVINGSHDGTDKGREAWEYLVKLLEQEDKP